MTVKQVDLILHKIYVTHWTPWRYIIVVKILGEDRKWRRYELHKARVQKGFFLSGILVLVRAAVTTKYNFRVAFIAGMVEDIRL